MPSFPWTKKKSPEKQHQLDKLNLALDNYLNQREHGSAAVDAIKRELRGQWRPEFTRFVRKVVVNETNKMETPPVRDSERLVSGNPAIFRTWKAPHLIKPFMQKRNLLLAINEAVKQPPFEHPFDQNSPVRTRCTA